VIKMNLNALRHSASHIMADAVKQLYPKARLGIGPAIKDGFYYDFDVPDSFTPEDLKRIEKKMAEIIKKDYKFEQETMPKKRPSSSLKN